MVSVVVVVAAGAGALSKASRLLKSKFVKSN